MRSTGPVAVLCLVSSLSPATAQEGRSRPTDAGAAAEQPGGPVDASLLAGMKFRSIGPAGMSGRVAAVESTAADPDLLYVGAATGGLWKSTNGGLTFEPLFDEQNVASIGAVAVHPRSHDVVWVGTGEGNPRNSASVGRGVFRSLDGGRTWQHLGLEKTERIHRICLHPDDPQVAYVAAMGTTWGENPERGVFKTEDGGKTWKQILYVDERTGCADLVMDPHNPGKLFAAMWEHRRWPWSFRSGGPGSGLYRTVDGGESWQRITDKDGLPEGELGRIGLAIAASDPRIVYALVEAKKSALLRSEDGGFTWRAVNREPGIASRPFYYCDLRVDPQNPDRVYNLHSLITVSIDGGKTFEVLVPFNKAHPDHHAMWIDPNDPRHIVIGNDGGVYISRDRGAAWRFCENLPLAQFYHISVDMDVPYHVYGGLQDNGSWRGPSQVWENGGIRNHHWDEVGFGDGFATLADPRDSLRGYSMSQEGYLRRFDLHTGERKDIRPPAPEGTELRFNWNAAIAQDPFDPETIYYGSQFVHKSGDRGDTWEVISPDLTTNNPEWQKQAESGGLTLDVTGAENFTTIMTIAPSALQRGVLWVGTDDGRVHLSRDGGRSWESLEDRIPDLPAHTWCPHIEPSKHDPASAFAVFDDHRRSNWTPYVYRTDDWGRTWRSLTSPAIDGYCLVVEQDPVDPDLLFLGTEFGLYVSQDGGASWFRWTHGLPTVSAMAMTVHPRDHDLVVGTHGRAVYVLDDIAPLRSLSAATLQEPLHLYSIADAIAYRVKQTGASRFPGQGEFRGENRPRGALITFSANFDDLEHPDPHRARESRPEVEIAEAAAKPEATGDEGEDEGDKDKDRGRITVEVRSAEGELLRTFKRPIKLGVNRIVWGLEQDGMASPSRELRDEPDVPPPGPEVLPGTYQITLKYRGQQASGEVKVLPDPRREVPWPDRFANHEAQLEGMRIAADLARVTERLAKAKKDLDLIAERRKAVAGKDDERFAALDEAVQAARKAWKELDELLWGPQGVQGIARRRGFVSEVMRARGSVASSWDAPNTAQRLGLQRARAKVAEARAAANAFLQGPFAAVGEAVRAAGLDLVPDASPIGEAGGK